jgi:hypothetical protein
MRNHARIALGTLLSLASCSTPQPAAVSPSAPAARAGTQDAAARPAPADSAEELFAEEGRMPDMPPSAASVDRVMHAHFHDAMLIRQAVLAGRYEQAIGPAKVLSIMHSDESMPSGWREFVLRMQLAAHRVSIATDLEQAASGAAELAVTCGQCHQQLGGPEASNEPLPATDTTVEGWMTRHQWASDRLWEGIVVPSADAWSAGAQALASPFPEQLLAAEGSSGRRAARQLGELVAKAPQLTESEQRGAMFAELLLACGTCHRAVKRPRNE